MGIVCYPVKRACIQRHLNYIQPTHLRFRLDIEQDFFAIRDE